MHWENVVNVLKNKHVKIRGNVIWEFKYCLKKKSWGDKDLAGLTVEANYEETTNTWIILKEN